MRKPKAMDVAVQMVKYAEQAPVIPYSQYDCYNIVRRAVEACGGSMRYSGSNNVYRSGVKNLMPLGEANSRDLLKAGWVLFIVRAESGKLPPQYHGDGMQDAYHMGIYTNMKGGDGVTNYEVVHSSQSRGGVYPSTLKNAWNWAAELVDVDYSDWHAEGPSDFGDLTGEDAAATNAEAAGSAAELTPNAPTLMPGPGEAKVITKDTGLILRKLPGKDGAAIKEIPRGAIVKVITYNGTDWTQVRWVAHDGTPHQGWVATRYLYFHEGAN